MILGLNWVNKSMVSIESINLLDFILRQTEIKDLEIFINPIVVYAFRNDNISFDLISNKKTFL